EDSRPNWDVCAFHSCRIAGTIPTLVMASNYWNHRVRKINSGKNIGTHGHMKFHLLELCRRKLSWLVQNVFGHCQFSGVMQKSCGLDCLDQTGVSNTHSAG